MGGGTYSQQAEKVSYVFAVENKYGKSQQDEGFFPRSLPACFLSSLDCYVIL